MDAMLATGDAQQLDEWREYYRLEPWGDDWERTSTAATQIINALYTLAAGFGGQKPDKDAMLEPDAFVPHREPAKPATMSLAQFRAVMRARIGV